MVAVPEVIDEYQDYRLALIHDEWAGAPYNDGGSPLVAYQVSWTGRITDIQQVTDITSYRLPVEILLALQHFNANEEADREKFERYLRIFHGMRSVVWIIDADHAFNYVTFDTEDWRTKMGLTDEYLRDHPDAEGTGFADASEYEAWLFGEVYGYRIDRRQRWLPVNDENEVVSFLSTTEKVTWEEEDSCFGFYGLDYAKEAAEEAFLDFLREKGIER